MSRSEPNYLQWHNSTYRVRYPIPEALRERYGKRWVLVPIDTAGEATARREAKKIVRAIRHELGIEGDPVQPNHVDARTYSNGWITPKRVFDAFGDVRFSMDVCSPGAAWCHTPASEHIISDSVEREWQGLVFMNPPYSMAAGLLLFLHKFNAHRNGIALLPVRPATRWFQENVLPVMDSILWVSPRLQFEPRTKGNATFDNVLCALGTRGVTTLEVASRNGLGVIR